MGFTNIKPYESTESQGIDLDPISIRSRSDLDPFEASNHRWQETPVELRHWAPKGKKDGDGFPDVWMKPLAMERSTMFKFGKNGNLGWFYGIVLPTWG